MSAYVAGAIESVIRREALAAAIADYEAEFGEITASELEATAIAGVLRHADAAANAPKRGAAKKERKQASKAS